MSAVPSNQTSNATRKQPPADLQQPTAAPTLEWEEPVREPRRGGKGSWLVAITASLLAVGLGYVSLQQWQARTRALTALGQSKTAVQTLTEERARNARSLAEQARQLTEQKQRIEVAAAELTDVKAKLGATEARLNELEAQSEAQKEHLAEFRSLTKQFQRMIDSGKLQISFRRGRMIVELPAAVLFASGSAELSPDGKQALQEIAKILRQVPGKRFMVGGHTDDVPIGKSTGTYSSNWSLSAARAVTVTESLIESGLRANHLVAAGYGEYDPIASNASDRGKQKNRRIEIVLEPELGGLPGAIADLKKDDGAAKKKK